MPSFVTSTDSEKEWDRAKKIVAKQYPDVDRKSEKFWKLVTTIWKSIAHYKPKNEMIEEAVLESLGFEDQIKSKLSLSRVDGVIFLYAKTFDGEKKLLFKGTMEDFEAFKQSVEGFNKELKSL
jgi:hypothetical protein